LSAPVNPSSSSPIAGSVLPIRRAEELLASLPGVISARIIASATGAVDEIHVLTTSDLAPKQTVRNIESALIAHLGMRVDHRKISVATTVESARAAVGPRPVVDREDDPQLAAAVLALAEASKRRLYFDDVEIRRSRVRGVSCRVSLRKGDESFVGEAEGLESERSRIELAARAALLAVLQAEGTDRALALDGVKTVDAFERQFVFAGVTAREGRETILLAGCCEVKESAETAAALAVLDATNRWIAISR